MGLNCCHYSRLRAPHTLIVVSVGVGSSTLLGLPCFGESDAGWNLSSESCTYSHTEENMCRTSGSSCTCPLRLSSDPLEETQSESPGPGNLPALFILPHACRWRKHRKLRHRVGARGGASAAVSRFRRVALAPASQQEPERPGCEAHHSQ